MLLKCNNCLNTIRKRKSKLSCQTCRSVFHENCIHADFDITGCCLQCLVPSVLPDLTEFLTGKGLNILHQNIRGLYTPKINLEHILVSLKGIDILGISETHLIDQIITEELAIEDVVFERKDRFTGNGGGIGMYIKQDVPYQRRFDLERGEIECIWIEVLFPKSKAWFSLATQAQA